MAPKRRTTFKFAGFRTWVDRVANTTAQNAAQQILDDLQVLSPAYSGEFRNAWIARPGDVRIPATRQPSAKPFSRVPNPTAIKRFVVPKLPNKGNNNNGYTIANLMTYRDIATDLVPGRAGPGRQLSAPFDWYRDYAEGGNLRLTLEKATAKTAQDPKIKGYKSFTVLDVNLNV